MKARLFRFCGVWGCTSGRDGCAVWLGDTMELAYDAWRAAHSTEGCL